MPPTAAYNDQNRHHTPILKLKKSKNVKIPSETGIVQEMSLTILGINGYKQIGYYDRNGTINQVEKKIKITKEQKKPPSRMKRE